MAAHPYVYPKSHQTVHLKWIDLMVGKLDNIFFFKSTKNKIPEDSPQKLVQMAFQALLAPHHSPPLPTPLQPHSLTLSTFWPQGLCTCCCLCLETSSVLLISFKHLLHVPLEEYNPCPPLSCFVFLYCLRTGHESVLFPGVSLVLM